MDDSDWASYITPPLGIETLVARKNGPLPDSDAITARSWLLDAEKELQRINDEIQKLEIRRTALMSTVEVYRAALAPHKILPIDILREIFICAAEGTSPTVNLNDIVNPRQAGWDIRLTISRVCSHWRSVALDMHTLWSDVRLDLEVGNTRRILEILSIWLFRSGECALNLDIAGVTDDPRATELLIRHSRRFRSLSISTGTQFVTSPAGAMDLLETLELYGNDQYESLLSMTAFAGAPRLRSATLRSFDNPINAELCTIPWHQLTELYVHDMFPLPSQYYSILDGCKSLTIAHLGIFQRGGPVPLAHNNIALPHLRTLELDGDDLTTYAIFLRCIELPSLGDLTLFTVDDRAGGTTFGVPEFPAMRRLCIDAADTISLLVPWLRACPSAIDVCLPYYHMLDSTLDEIADGRLLPNVEMLIMWAASPGTLIKTLQARQRSLQHSTITEVGIHVGTLSRPEIASVTKLMTDGIFLAAHYPTRLDRGEIQQVARSHLETGSGLFESQESSESDTESESESDS
ncbi:hypothetical protein C8R44DRAFT_224859 [Mycena epipterygia]|nr:hypothetical protein C8R44DRAFT_224859 [Mycena epipterygia]